MFSPKVSIRPGLKEENDGHQVSANPKIKDSQSNLQDSNNGIVVHQDARIKNEVEIGDSEGILEAMSSVIVTIRFGRLSLHEDLFKSYAFKYWNQLYIS